MVLVWTLFPTLERQHKRETEYFGFGYLHSPSSKIQAGRTTIPASAPLKYLGFALWISIR